MDNLEKYKNNPLALEAWQEGYEEGLWQCKMSNRTIVWICCGVLTIFALEVLL